MKAALGVMNETVDDIGQIDDKLQFFFGQTEKMLADRLVLAGKMDDITYDIQFARIQEEQAHMKNRLKDHFAAQDTNANRRLSVMEQSGMKDFAVSLGLEWPDSLDRNSDGKLSTREVIKGLGPSIKKYFTLLVATLDHERELEYKIRQTEIKKSKRDVESGTPKSELRRMSRSKSFAEGQAAVPKMDLDKEMQQASAAAAGPVSDVKGMGSSAPAPSQQTTSHRRSLALALFEDSDEE
jgi:hypothetical protein